MGTGNSADMRGEGSRTAETLQRLAEGLNGAAAARVPTARETERDDVATPCVVNAFVSGSPVVRSSPGYVRNVSPGGAGVLTTRPMIRGEPVEIAVPPVAGGEARFLGGLVAFCRHLEDEIYEVGVQLVTRAREPILSLDPEDALPDWAREALELIMHEPPAPPTTDE